MKGIRLWRKITAGLIMIVLFALIMASLLHSNGWFSFSQVVTIVMTFTSFGTLLFGLACSYGIDAVLRHLREARASMGIRLIAGIALYAMAGFFSTVLATLVLMVLTQHTGIIDAWMMGLRLSPFGMTASLLFAVIEAILKYWWKGKTTS
ncbi:hypothetical protein [Paenibacillus sp. 1001270B_150601_E10]|uniref:hypothetical protein n=1 Tax=Paenibacillus sp. 1001270B_150601_E10 TaxID=2787079 RepID=UPI00189FEF3F|nr:hypothetical protein [Paenibacillus sp. 1001270B_150601_E10]